MSLISQLFKSKNEAIIAGSWRLDTRKSVRYKVFIGNCFFPVFINNYFAGLINVAVGRGLALKHLQQIFGLAIRAIKVSRPRLIVITNLQI